MTLLTEAAKMAEHLVGIRNMDSIASSEPDIRYNLNVNLKAEALLRGICHLRPPKELLQLRIDFMAHLISHPKSRCYPIWREYGLRFDLLLSELTQKVEKYMACSLLERKSLACLRPKKNTNVLA